MGAEKVSEGEGVVQEPVGASQEGASEPEGSALTSGASDQPQEASGDSSKSILNLSDDSSKEAASSEPAPEGVENDSSEKEQSAEASWKDSLPDEIKDDPSLSHIKDVESLAKSYVHAQKMVGQDKITVPGKHATEDDWKGVFKKLGLPESKDEYSLEAPEGAPEEAIDKFKEVAMEKGILPSQAQSVLDWLSEHGKEQAQAMEQNQKQAREEKIGQLKKEWGDEFDKNLSAAKAVVREYGDDDIMDHLDKTGLGDDPAVIKLLAKAGQNLLEDSIAGNRQTSYEHPEQVKSQIDSIMGDFNHPYHNREHPGHQDAVKEVNRLFSKMTEGA